MRQRLISAAFGVPLIAAVLLLYNTVVLNIVVALISILALYEVFVAMKYIQSRGLAAASFVYTAVMPFFNISRMHLIVMIFSYLFIVVLFSLLMHYRAGLKLEQIGTAFMLTVMISLAFSSIVFLRDIFSTHGYTTFDSLFYLALIFIGAWITDAGAYFVGRFLGRHKMAPQISPKKTVEGAVGGVVCSTVLFPVAGLIYQSYAASLHIGVTVNYPLLVVMGVLCALAAIFGDLAASIIKRECRIKDFGHILPGHGGIMDRFDSVMFVAPLLYVLVQIVHVVSVGTIPV
ncbi:phosphatidate cytidylyltransferase [Ethanoligenens harbinense]|uniref:Phosphatidate cytidylyltransferase n=1 Tax=Ethanoligenens harbinense (strain DSM 18485 / JCM 12961 / CGMCC 1.5033 / YUAN-3) TaxID=663278 RepID=E6U8S0_ETHHY|nr:CDP-archaeol synthase [Ethanoligenens harbinense]ADU27155.1 phosphatidate cytidylyltransferase [Ethanoligenens harbinense YUAN-3]AVQ96226.1 CDP-archaeol synthase [Ethanoligenens harbinense YUAN-3]AYF38886.1 CDP-archaeol synthase [Ethanoligenens harbinense]AYF41636.1 CDP-archaeol synthase [Ethanoligenens harbinense]QCN92467.1 CDP-archaeol synthase [Ethanoligenens harbinense]